MKIGTGAIVPIRTFGLEKGLEVLAKAGFEAIDYGLPEVKKPEILQESDEVIAAYYADVRKKVEQNNLYVNQTHAPTPTFSEEWDNRLVFDTLRKGILASSVLGAKYMVFHPVTVTQSEEGTFLPQIYEKNREVCKAANVEFFSRMIPYLEEYNVKAAIENIWIYNRYQPGRVLAPTICSDPYDLADCVDKLNAMCKNGDRFVACLDVGHANICCRHMSMREVVNALGHRLEVLHVHDNNGLDDLHIAPFLGNVDWESFCLGLKDIDYQGVFNFETAFYRKVEPELIPAEQAFLCQIARHFGEKYGL